VSRLALALCVVLAAAHARAGEPGPLFPILKGGKWGYMDRTGAVVIPPQFDRAGRFSDGLAAVAKGDALGYVDAGGKMVLVPAYATVDGGPLHRPFSGGLAAVRQGQRIGYIDKAGKMVVPPAYLTAEDFSEGFALVCYEKGCGFVDATGSLRGSQMWMGGAPFKNGYGTVYLAMAMGRKRTQFVSRSGNVVPGEFEDNGGFVDGLAPVRIRGRWGYVDPSGKPVLAPRWSEAGDFSEGLAPVKVWETDRCGYVDRTGAYAIEPAFAACRPFSGGLARVDLSASPELGEKVAFVDRTGKVVLRGDGASPPFLGAEDFRDGLAAVGVGGPPTEAGIGAAKLGYVDTAGRWVWPPTQ
jgi:hypothetical protein